MAGRLNQCLDRRFRRIEAVRDSLLRHCPILSSLRPCAPRAIGRSIGLISELVVSCVAVRPCATSVVGRAVVTVFVPSRQPRAMARQQGFGERKMRFTSKKWWQPAVGVAAVGLMAVVGYVLVGNRQIIGAFATRTPASPSAVQGHDESCAEAVHAHGKAEHDHEAETLGAMTVTRMTTTMPANPWRQGTRPQAR